jgi:hypothetical protein
VYVRWALWCNKRRPSAVGARGCGGKDGPARFLLLVLYGEPTLDASVHVQIFKYNELESLFLVTSMFVLLAGMTFQSGVTAAGARSHTALTYLVAMVLMGCVALFCGMLAMEVWCSVQYARRASKTLHQPSAARRSQPATSGRAELRSAPASSGSPSGAQTGASVHAGSSATAWTQNPLQPKASAHVLSKASTPVMSLHHTAVVVPPRMVSSAPTSIPPPPTPAPPRYPSSPTPQSVVLSTAGPATSNSPRARVTRAPPARAVARSSPDAALSMTPTPPSSGKALGVGVTWGSTSGNAGTTCTTSTGMPPSSSDLALAHGHVVPGMTLAVSSGLLAGGSQGGMCGTPATTSAMSGVMSLRQDRIQRMTRPGPSSKASELGQ